ncbi:MAG: hypothetical protein JAY90_23470 [Candidatus Thiodiazotropha lotti]|nr:hypothetical protein [Candidatus Thiodiazotropha lotti]
MTEQQGKIEPHRITKPIQLLAAWLLGLIIVNGAFLLAASNIEEPEWIAGVLVIASIINVPLFLTAIFLLQTKFRPEMQEDSFYSQYLESKTGNTERQVTAESVEVIREDIASLEKKMAENIEGGLGDSEVEKLKWSSVTVAINKSIKNFSSIAKNLSTLGIPVHETFGGGDAGVPDTFHVAIGAGFDIDQIRLLLGALVQYGEGVISFAHDEDEGPGQYDRQVLIGAYGDHSHGIEIEKAMVLLDKEGASVADAYKIFGN